MEVLRFTLENGFPADSPFFNGHFVGNPIAPGAIILGTLSARLNESGKQIVQVHRMKFNRPLRPDMAFEVTVARRGSSYRAEFRDHDGVFATAGLVIRPAYD